ncbi:hypothetical protein PR048_020573 [Dryococelus australis]|uniref:NR LBD domain-containing protein n=1 Tax=Dryococelus australis TaxID=614101 RepID=A0ABQ9H6P8_9NEOP|nr:hypothetical protein PR048_020573 [Dryococelus australis]
MCVARHVAAKVCVTNVCVVDVGSCAVRTRAEAREGAHPGGDAAKLQLAVAGEGGRRGAGGRAETVGKRGPSAPGHLRLHAGQGGAHVGAGARTALLHRLPSHSLDSVVERARTHHPKICYITTRNQSANGYGFNKGGGVCPETVSSEGLWRVAHPQQDVGGCATPVMPVVCVGGGGGGGCLTEVARVHQATEAGRLPGPGAPMASGGANKGPVRPDRLTLRQTETSKNRGYSIWESCRAMTAGRRVFSGISHLPPPFHSSTAPYSRESPSPALKTSLEDAEASWRPGSGERGCGLCQLPWRVYPPLQFPPKRTRRQGSTVPCHDPRISIPPRPWLAVTRIEATCLVDACPLNPNPHPLTGQQEMLQDFSKRFSPAIRGVVEFAKRIPGFSLLPQDDQVTLLKAGVFEVLLVRLACMFDSQTNSMICLNGQVLKRESIHNSSNARFLMDSMFDFADRLNSLRLTDAEVALFSAVVVVAPDRPGLRNTEIIERMQCKLKAALQVVVSQNHPHNPNICHELMKKIPDLRTLNTLHSEKLLAFKMTEQQQQMQQQQQMWGMPLSAEEESSSKSPAGSSSWSSSSDVTMDEAVKSPLGSVSSTESVCSGEVASLTEHTSHQATSTPLLAATLAGGVCPHRHRANSGSTSGDDDMMGLHHHGHAIAGPSRPVIQHRFRKLDSPSDSGIESGTEKVDKLPSSAPTSVCSSPRSSLEDKEDEKHSHNSQIVEDMPVLKRVLQAPPLYDTNSLMDEAYKPHKKFRALRNKDSAEAEPMVMVSPHQQPANHHHSSPQLHHHLTANNSSLSSTHSTLAKSLMEGPRMTAEQLKHTDIIHNYIMRGDVGASAKDFLASSMASAASTTSTVDYKLNSENVLVCATTTASPNYHYIPQQLQQQAQQQQQQQQQQQHIVGRWQSGGAFGSTSVITTTMGRPPSTTYVFVPNNSSPPLQSSEFSRLYFQPQTSPHHASSSTSPAPQHRKTPPSSSSPISSLSPTSTATLVVSAASPKVMELQVDIADSQQPLNLSKKSPSPSPRPIGSPAASMQHTIVSLEA